MGNEKQQSNTVEKITFIAGVVILLVILGYLGWQTFKGRSQPPHLVVNTKYEPSMDKYAFSVHVKNDGEETAEAANIKFDLYQDGKSVDKVTLQLKYVPIHSEESAWVVFNRTRKPTDSLVVTSMTFVKP
ncbi:MAG: hypothetical protein WBL27_10140 [Salinimicrobium sp.]